MSAVPLRGHLLARSLYGEIKAAVARIEVEGGWLPHIAVVRIGDNRDTQGYARTLQKAARQAGFGFKPVQLPATSSADAAIAQLKALNAEETVAGILLLTPLPPPLQTARLHWYLDPDKDIDGAHPENLGRLMSDSQEALVPATPAAGMALLDQTGLELKGKEAVVIGRSLTVGKPLGLLLLQHHCTVSMAHSRTTRLADVASKADVLCVAVGQPHLVTGKFVKPGAIVLDFGTTYLEAGVTGDCEPESVSAQAAAFTPVPGGIGPLTNAMLMRNALQALKRRTQLNPGSVLA